jgi:NAD(P)-dependent dehydrogenase (short-subunit alcohol dehydrogenase family)
MVQPTLNTEVYPAIHPSNFTSQFHNKLVVVTGAGRGIGRHISLAFAKAGATLALLDFDTDRQSETKSLCEAAGAPKVYTFACDVTKYDQCAKVVEEIGRVGEIDVLVNNAGGGPIRGFTSQKFEDFWAGVEQNFKGAMIMMHLVLPGMKERKKGCIVNIASRLSFSRILLIAELEQSRDRWQCIIILERQH